MKLPEIAQKKHLFAQSKVGDETILVPLKSSVANMNEMFTLNELGSFLWDQISESSSIDMLTDEVIENFDIDKQTAKSDIEDFVSQVHSFIATI